MVSRVHGFDRAESLKDWYSKKCEFKEKTMIYQSMLSLEELAWLSALSDDMVSAAENSSKRMHAQVHSILRYADAKSGTSTKQHLSFIDSNGNRIQSVVEGKLAFKEHFATVLGGTQISQANLALIDQIPDDSSLDDVDSCMFEYSAPLRVELCQC